MTTAKQIREKAEAAQAAFEANEKALYRTRRRAGLQRKRDERTPFRLESRAPASVPGGSGASQ